MPLPSYEQAGTAGTSGVSPRGGTFFFMGGTDDLWAGGRGGIQKVPIFLGFENNNGRRTLKIFAPAVVGRYYETQTLSHL